jgi:hypothetical protein
MCLVEVLIYNSINKKIKRLFVNQFINLLITLSRKAEGLDPLKPWQPLIYEKGATFYK